MLSVSTTSESSACFVRRTEALLKLAVVLVFVIGLSPEASWLLQLLPNFGVGKFDVDGEVPAEASAAASTAAAASSPSATATL